MFSALRTTLVALLALAIATKGNAATVPATFDCDMRKLALEFSQHIQPGITPEQLHDVAAALNGAPEHQCTVEPKQQLRSVSKPKRVSIPSNAIVVAPDGKDTNPGTADLPLKTIAAAVTKSRDSSVKTIALKAGIYRERNTIELDEQDSGLTLCNFDEGKPIISGARVVEVTWEKVATRSKGFDVYSSPVNHRFR